MSYAIKEEILLLDKKANALTLKEQILKVSNKCFGESNVRIKAKGLIGQGDAELIRLGILRHENAEIEVHNSIVDLKVLTDTGVDNYKITAETVVDVVPNDPNYYRELFFKTSKAEATTGTVPGQAYGGSIVQSGTVGKGLMHFHHIAHTTFYLLFVSTNPDPSVLSSYVACDPSFFTDSHGGMVTVATGIKLWFRIQACNGHGKGDLSEPFGGFSFSPTL